MRKVYCSILLLLFFCAQSVRAAELNSYSLIPSELQGWSWYQSTILGDLAKPIVDRSIVLQLPSIHSNKNLKVRLWRAQSAKGLFLVLPGTGGDSSSAMANSMAADLSELGYDALVLVDPFSPAFQSSFSSDALIGVPQKDAIDTNKMLEAAVKLYTAEYSAPKSVNLIGSSLGGLYVAMEASTPSSLNFEKLIVVNPPIHLQFAVDRLDDAIRSTLPNAFSWLDLYLGLLPAFLKARHGVTLDNLDSIRKALPASEKTGSQEIGKSFQETLIQVTRGLFSAPGIFSSDLQQNQIESEINSLTFQRYMGFVEIAIADKGLFPNSTFASLMEEVNLSALLNKAKDPAKISVITNQDDFIIQPSFLEEISPILGSRLQVFSAGGHCGNFWTPSFKNALANILSR